MDSEEQSEVIIVNGLGKWKQMWINIYENKDIMKIIEILCSILPIFYLIADMVYNKFYQVNAQQYYHINKEYFHASTLDLIIKTAAFMVIFLMIYMFIKFIAPQSKCFSILMCILFGLEIGGVLLYLFMLGIDNHALGIIPLGFLNDLADRLGMNFALAIILIILITPIFILFFFSKLNTWMKNNSMRYIKKILSILVIVFCLIYGIVNWLEGNYASSIILILFIAPISILSFFSKFNIWMKNNSMHLITKVVGFLVFLFCLIDGIVLINGVSIVLSATPQTKRVYEIIEGKQSIILSKQDDRCLVVRYEYDKQNNEYTLDTSSYEFIDEYEYPLSFIEMEKEPIIKNEQFDSK